ncbi:MAG TPA: hypothetical protein VFW17_21710 [Ktedonobacterales bacterium]|nr:hypothetical protein [Ktedonobacterales bacterium]
MSIPHSTAIRVTTEPMRWLFRSVSALALITGFSLYVLSERTDHFFSWTILPPITAAFFGACFWTAAIIAFLASRQHVWIRARIAGPVILSFTVLTLIATLLHLEKFHLFSSDMVARGAAWAWMILYVVVPPVTLVLLPLQLRTPGHDPARSRPLFRWLRVTLGIQAGVLVAVGLVLFLAPQTATFWPWKLTPLTAQVTGGWLLAVGGAAAQTVWENDWSRVAIALISYTALGALQLVALARYVSQIQWSSLWSWLYTLFVVTIVVVGVVCWRTAWPAAVESPELAS